MEIKRILQIAILFLAFNACGSKIDNNIRCIKDFYKSYITTLELNNNNSERINLIKETYLTTNLINKLEKLELDYDPILNAQDVDSRWVNDIKFKKDLVEDNVYHVSYTNGAFFLRITMVKNIDGTSKINDIDDVSKMFLKTNKIETNENLFQNFWVNKFSYKTRPFRVDSVSNISIYYNINIKKDSVFFSGQGYKTNFYDLCYAKENKDTLNIFYKKTIEGTDYNKSDNPIAKIFKKDNKYFVISSAIKDVPVLLTKE